MGVLNERLCRMILRVAKHRKKPITRLNYLIIACVCLLCLLTLAAMLTVFLLKPKPELPAVYGDLRLPPVGNLTAHAYDISLFKLQDNGLMTYQSDSHDTWAGVDVSAHQNIIQWRQVAQSGLVDFAMIRSGYRGGVSGSINLDENFHRNMRGAIENGIPVGVYFFSQAITPEEAREEALQVLEWVEEYEITYPIVFDWEFQYEIEGCRTNDMTAAILTQCAMEFCNVIYCAGYTPMVYFYQFLAFNYYDLSTISAYDFWLAEHDRKPPTFPYAFTIYQYSNVGKIPGIEKGVDLNICLKDYAVQA